MNEASRVSNEEKFSNKEGDRGVNGTKSKQSIRQRISNKGVKDLH